MNKSTKWIILLLLIIVSAIVIELTLADNQQSLDLNAEIMLESKEPELLRSAFDSIKKEVVKAESEKTDSINF